MSYSRPVQYKVSNHAKTRMQQRGITQDYLPLVLGYGQKEYDGRGGIRYFMNKRSIKKLEKILGPVPLLDKIQGVYAVVNVENDAVLTVSHRH